MHWGHGQLHLTFQLGFGSNMEAIRFSRSEALGYRGLQVGMSRACIRDWGLRVRELLHIEISLSWNLD